MRPARVLILEDELNVGLTLSERFQDEGFQVDWAKSCREATELLKTNLYELTLLDVGLPDGNGFDLARSLRKSHPRVAIIFLTAYGDADQRIQGLELGAEDYLVKPFHFKELLLRVQNALRRSEALIEKTVESPVAQNRVGRATIRWASYEIESGGEVTTLTHKECSFLRYLIQKEGEVVSRDQILDSLWGTESFPSHRTVDNFIVRFRKWIEVDVDNPQYIKSVRGVGYQLIKGSVQ